MMKLKIRDGRALIQAGISNGPELATAIEKAIRKHFPKSLLKVKFRRHPLKSSVGVINLFFVVAGSHDETVNKILDNDISLTRATIYGMDPEGNFTGKLEFDPFQGGSVWAGRDSIKVGLRKKTTPKPELLVKHIDTYFGKLLKTIKDNADKLDDEQRSLLKSIDLKG